MRAVVRGLLVLGLLTWSLGCTNSNSGGPGGAAGTHSGPAGMQKSGKSLPQPNLPPPPPPPARGH